MTAKRKPARRSAPVQAAGPRRVFIAIHEGGEYSPKWDAFPTRATAAFWLRSMRRRWGATKTRIAVYEEVRSA